MPKNHTTRVIIVFGPPGSGKGTQADLLARHFGFIHFDTGEYLEKLIHDSAQQRDPVIARNRTLFDSGKLMAGDWVFHVIKQHIAELCRGGFGIVLSGSPRTLEETKKFLPLLEQLYKGKQAIQPVILRVAEKSSLLRNTHRLQCLMCSVGFLAGVMSSLRVLSHCPICGGPLHRRTLDKPAVIRERFREYHMRTQPIFSYLKKRGYRIPEVSGEQLPYAVFRATLKRIPS